VGRLPIPNPVADNTHNTPSFEIPEPESTLDTGMEGRIARRIFGDTGAREASTIKQVAHYEILRRVGAGGMGVVYAARDPRLGRVVALKLVRRRAMSSAAHQRLVAEAKTLAKLSHPNVVGVFEVGEEGGDVYIAMEFVDGQTLQHWQTQPERRRGELLDAYRQAGAGLAAAHAQGVVHRDFKPTNVLVGTDRRVRVVDFGLAIDPSLEPGDTVSSQGDHEPTNATPPAATRVAGSPGYIAPELIAGSPADARSDQFSFCVSLWEALAGTRPFQPRQLAEAGGADLPSLPTPAGSVSPAWLRRALLRGLELDPSKRWPTLEDLLQTLDRRPRRQWFMALGLLVGGSLVGALTGIVAMDGGPASCGDPSAGFDEVWSEAHTLDIARRAQSLAPTWGAGVGRRLSAARASQRAAWRHASLQACRAVANDEGADGATAAELRSSSLAAEACLGHHLRRVATLLTHLDEGDIASFKRLDHLLAVLGDPLDCLEVQPGRAPPGWFTGDARVLEQRLDDAQMHLAEGHYAEARTLSRVLIDEAEALEFSPMISAALALDGRVAQALLQGPDAERSLRRAYLEALSSHDDALLFDLRSRLAEVHIDLLGDPETGQRWRDRAEASFAALSPDRRSQVYALDADIAFARGDYGQAEAALERSIETALDPLTVERREHRLATAIAERGEHRRALRLYERLLESRRLRLGEHHPDVVRVEFNISLTLLDLAQVEDTPAELAQELLERARDLLEPRLADLEALLGPDSLGLAAHRTALSQVYSLLGQPGRALIFAAAAARVHDPAPGPNATHANALRDASWLSFQQWNLHDSFLFAERLAGQPSHLGPGEAENLALNLGWIACRLGRYHDAAPLFEQALGSDDPEIVLQAEVGLTEIRLRRGEVRSALADLEVLRRDPRLHEATNPATAGEIDALSARARRALDPADPQAAVLERRSRVLLKEAGMSLSGYEIASMMIEL